MTPTQSGLILALFMLLLALPFLPGVMFLRRRADEQPLRVDPEYSRDPLFFGQQLRQKYAEATDIAVREGLTSAAPVPQTPLLVTGPVALAGASTLGDLYLQRGGTLAGRTQLQALVSDQSVACGERLAVQRFIEVRGDLATAPESDLGTSAAATGRLALQAGTRFRRLYGDPVVVEGDPIFLSQGSPSVGDEYLWGRDGLRIPKGQVLSSGVICHGSLHVGENSSILGDVKVYGDLHLMPGAFVQGNVVARGSVILYAKNVVKGHVHTEKNLFVGSGSVLGRPEVQLSFYVAGRTILTPQITLFGYLVTDRGGQVMRPGETLGTDFPKLRG